MRSTVIIQINNLNVNDSEIYMSGSCFVLFVCFLFVPYPTHRSICSSVVRTLAHGAMGRRIDPSWVGPIELFLVPASDPRLV